MTPLSGGDEGGGRGGPDREARSRVSRCRGRARLDGCPGRGGDAIPGEADQPLRLADVGPALERPFAYPVPDRDQSPDREGPAADLVLQRQGHRDRDTRGRRRHRRTSATGRATSTRSTSKTGRPRWTLPGARPRSGVRGPDRVVGRGRRRRAACARCSSAAARRCTRCGPTTARCAGSTSSGRRGDDEDPTEIESSPVVVRRAGDLRLRRAQQREGRARRRSIALDAAHRQGALDHGDRAPTEGDGATGSGCGDVWGSPTVDRGGEARLRRHRELHQHPDGWGRFSEAIVALDLDDRATVRWTYQPHQPNHDDLDFAGAPNLFDGRRPGRSSASATRTPRTTRSTATGELVWRTQVTEPGIPRPANFSTGGFIGATAVADGVVVGGTAVGGTPCLHGSTPPPARSCGSNPRPADTYASAAIANGVVVHRQHDRLHVPGPRPADRRGALVDRS